MKTNTLTLFLYFLLFCFYSATSQNPQWKWAKGFGTSEVETGELVKTDLQKNIFMAGRFKDSSLQIGNVTLVNQTAGFYDIYIAKLDSQGNVLWAVSAGSQSDDLIKSMAVDKTGAVYITGGYGSGGIKFGGKQLNLNSGVDLYLAKLSASGTFEWALSSSNSDGLEIGTALCVSDNHVILSGDFSGTTISFESFTHNNTTLYTGDVFLNKYSLDGTLIWSKSFQGASNDGINEMTTDAAGNIYATGITQSDSFIVQSLKLLKSGGVSALMLKFDSSGLAQWGKAVGGNSGNTEGLGITVTPNGDVFMAGTFNDSSISMGSIQLTNASQTATYDAFLMGCNNSGNPIMGKRFGGSADDFGVSIDHWQNGDLAFGMFFYSSTLTGFTHSIPSNSGGRDALMARLNSSGIDTWVQPLQGTLDVILYDMAIDVSSSLIAIGIFNTFDLKIGNDSLYTKGTTDFFIAKLLPQAINNSVPTFYNYHPINVFPNPASQNINLINRGNEIHTLYLFNANGECVGRYSNLQGSQINSMDISHLPSGIYFLQCYDQKNTLVTLKFIKQD